MIDGSGVFCPFRGLPARRYALAAASPPRGNVRYGAARGNAGTFSSVLLDFAAFRAAKGSAPQAREREACGLCARGRGGGAAAGTRGK